MKRFNVLIDVLSPSRDEGKIENKWKKEASIFGSIKPIFENSLSEIEGINFGNIILKDLYLIKTRFTPKIRIDMRLKIREEVFEINKLINQDYENKILNIIVCKINIKT